MGKRQCGVSTHLYQRQRLCRAHLLEIAAHGFETVEVFATRTHFDYHNPSAVADLQQWLAEAGLVLSSLHAPVGESYAAGGSSGWLSLASSDDSARERAVAEAERALHVARRIPVGVLVVHLGVPRALQPAGGDLRKADLDGAPIGIGFDIGHAHLEGDVGEALETVSEHVLTVDVHDNRGRFDDHRMPFEGTVDWPAALTAVQKIGYEGPLMFEAGGREPTRELLGRAGRARERMERLITT